jgi:hypothetical protein
MPAGDGTGPVGAGPMTGRAAGYCAGYAVPGYMNPIYGRGRYGYFGRGGRGGYGRGRGWRHWYYATGMPGWARAYYDMPAYGGWPAPAPGTPVPPEMTSKQEMDMLRHEADMLQSQLEEIRNRIEVLENVEQKEDEK